MGENRLMEAIQRDPRGFTLGWEAIQEKARNNPLYQLAIREAKYSDIAGALGGIHDQVWDAARYAAIGREIIPVFPTEEALVRFFLQVRGKAYQVGEGRPFATGEKAKTSDINADIELAYEGRWTQTYLEDANWSVMEREIGEAGYQLGKLETEKILTMYEAVGTDGAGAALMGLNDGIEFVWADVVKAWRIVYKEGFIPTDLVIAPEEAEGLLGTPQFLQSLYYADEQVIKKGVTMNKIGQTYLGMAIWVTPLLTAAHKLCIAVPNCAAMIVRRDVTTVPFESPADREYGFAASERVGMKVLKPKAVGCDT